MVLISNTSTVKQTLMPGYKKARQGVDRKEAGLQGISRDALDGLKRAEMMVWPGQESEMTKKENSTATLGV